MTDQNTDPYAVMVPYGPTADDVIPVERAAVILRILRDEQPALLSALIGRAFTGTAPAVTRNRPKGA
jgi:hypothetical protein